ncbi:sodium-dependent transporter [Gemmiger sp. An120]|uniref:sodium-dependent transporter n=1 Tax=Gemmiger sp. An120 TaxID=1965549 RepID=UPI000B37C148|nr:sodium-dependent transporter [Gemmiger sp. An120]OUQ41109.1 sodium-dependent transporter [Gemmiger sp. An120]HIX32728.1 sodium-dependent transporter [Candidatus Gemmiger avium]
MQRERFKSRLGFLLLSAGCAIGLGNVWRFPYMVGQNGGAFFVLFYLLFLIIMGLPILSMELAVGRASRKSIIREFETLEKPGSKWHWYSPFGMLGNYMLMFFYTVVGGWLVNYFVQYLTGSLAGLDSEGVQAAYASMLSDPAEMISWMLVVVLIGFVICLGGLQKGVERISKWMMVALLALILVLAVRSLTLPGGGEGLAFYLMPNLENLKKVGLVNCLAGAMEQSFFTLSLGIGAIAIFGSYMDKDRTLLGESVGIAALDTFVAITAGLIIFPACFAYGVAPDSGPNLLFVTLPNVFINMAGGRLWGALFFLFMSFAALTTVVAVFENILACCMDKWGWTRKKAVLVNLVILALGSVPCALGFNVWSNFNPLGAGTVVMDLEDFIVSTILLPFGSLLYLLFCTRRSGWGFDAYLEEANTGKGLKMARALRFYLTWILPVMVAVLLVMGLWSKLKFLFVA